MEHFLRYILCHQCINSPLVINPSTRVCLYLVLVAIECFVNSLTVIWDLKFNVGSEQISNVTKQRYRLLVCLPLVKGERSFKKTVQ